MENLFVTSTVKGKPVEVPALRVDDRTLTVSGTWLRTASIHDEEWQETSGFSDLTPFIASLKKSGSSADLFTFTQGLPHHEVRHEYHAEMEDVAAVPITTFTEWWESLPQESRKNVRRSERRGVTVRVAAFDDVFVDGIKKIYDETPVRQGRKFWHYGKDREAVRRENSTYLDRCDFIGAYFNEELIGFIKIVYVGNVARIMQIISLNAHFDKRPTNALIAKAMEVCCQRGMSYFVYGRFFYGNKGDTPITEFKRRNGFQRILILRYYVPLTAKGKLAVAANLHLGLKSWIPRRFLNFLLDLRACLYQKTLPAAKASDPASEPADSKELLSKSAA